jgi:hypothetical protein
MTREEFGILAKGMKAVYTMPSFLPDSYAMNVWYSLLKDLDYQVVQVAIQKYMMTETKIPTIADIRNLCATVMIGDKPLWSDGWEEVLRAIRMYGSYNEEKALESMSEITKQCVRRLGYQNLCKSEEIGVERANFRMIFEQIANREHEKAKIPANVQRLIESVQTRMIETRGD